MPSLYFNYPSDTACPFHRSLQPARFCAPKFREHGWEITTGPGLPKGHDVTIFHGLPQDGDTLAAVLLATRYGKFVWSVDDDWLSIPEWNPAKPNDVQIAVYHMLKKVADYIICSTPTLAETFADVGEKVFVAPNLLDMDKFPAIPTREVDGKLYPELQPRLPVRVVWSGGYTHSGDLEVMTEVLDRFLANVSADRAVVIFNGMSPPARILTKYLHRNLFHQPMTPFASYQQVLNSIDSHVYLAPLAQVPFNLSKSNLRVLEGWALGAAPLATEWGEYNCIANGMDGRLVPNDPDAWCSALMRLVNDHETRIRMAIRGYCRVNNEYNWQREECRSGWYKALATIIGVTL